MLGNVYCMDGIFFVVIWDAICCKWWRNHRWIERKISVRFSVDYYNFYRHSALWCLHIGQIIIMQNTHIKFAQIPATAQCLSVYGTEKNLVLYTKCTQVCDWQLLYLVFAA